MMGAWHRFEETRALEPSTTSSGSVWARFFLDHHQSLTVYALSLCGNLADAQDLIQDVLVRMVEQDRSVRKARPFVMRCLRNLAIDRHRAVCSRPSTQNLDEAHVVASASFVDTDSGGVEQRETAERLRRSLECLPADRREVVVLKLYADLTFREIAGVLGRPIGTVTSTYARALHELRLILDRELKDVIE